MKYGHTQQKEGTIVLLPHDVHHNIYQIASKTIKTPHYMCSSWQQQSQSECVVFCEHILVEKEFRNPSFIVQQIQRVNLSSSRVRQKIRRETANFSCRISFFKWN